MMQALRDTVHAAADDLPLVVIQWKQLAVVVTLFSGATIGIIVAIYRGWLVVSATFEKSVRTHAVPLITAFKDEFTPLITGLNLEIGKLNRNLEHLQMSDATRARDLDDTEKRLFEVEEHTQAHEVRLSELKARFDSLEKFSGQAGRHQGGRPDDA